VLAYRTRAPSSLAPDSPRRPCVACLACTGAVLMARHTPVCSSAYLRAPPHIRPAENAVPSTSSIGRFRRPPQGFGYGADSAHDGGKIAISYRSSRHELRLHQPYLILRLNWQFIYMRLYRVHIDQDSYSVRGPVTALHTSRSMIDRNRPAALVRPRKAPFMMDESVN
jgi:hypothetical protein